MKATMQICRLFGVTVTLACAVVGCCRVPPPATVADVRSAVCTFWRDDGASAHLMGGGVFLALDDGGRRRMFCLTARHVVTMPSGDGSEGGFFLHPEKMVLAIEGLRGGMTWKHGIAPERWMTGELCYDLAWFELAEEERRCVAAAGGLPIAASTNASATAADVLRISGGGGFVPGAAAGGIESWGNSVLTNNASLLAFIGLSRDRNTEDAEKCGGAVTNVSVVLKNAAPQRVELSFDGHKNLKKMRARQVIAEFKTEKGDSGMPVFATAADAPHPVLIGVVSGYKEQPAQSGIMPIDEALRKVLDADARRLVELKQLQ